MLEKDSCDIARNPRLLWWAWAPLAREDGGRDFWPWYGLAEATKIGFMVLHTACIPCLAAMIFGAVAETVITMCWRRCDL